MSTTLSLGFVEQHTLRVSSTVVTMEPDVLVVLGLEVLSFSAFFGNEKETLLRDAELDGALDGVGTGGSVGLF